MSRRNLVPWICLTALALASAPESAFANGRPPATVNARFQPGSDELMLVPSTWGLLLSKDGGESFHWVCEDVIGYGGTYDPDYAITSDGTIYATTFEGLRYSTDSACTFQDTQFYGDPTGGDNPELLEQIWVGEVEVASDGKIWACTSTGGESNDVYVSDDGVVFNSANNWDELIWWKSLRVSQSNPDTVYVTGFQIEQVHFSASQLRPSHTPLIGEDNGPPIPNPATADQPERKIKKLAIPAAAHLRKTTDGGQSWQALPTDAFDFGAQPNLLMAGVDPNDPNIVYVRVVGARSPIGDDIYRSDDGGETFTKIIEMAGTISAFTVKSDGGVIAGSTIPCDGYPEGEADAGDDITGCVLISPTGAPGTFEEATTQPRMGCVGERPSDGSLFACGHNWDPDNFAFGRSTDGGQTWEKVFRFVEVKEAYACSAESPQNECDQVQWPTVCATLGICPPSPDAGVTGEDDDDGEPSSCGGCQNSSQQGSLFALGIAALLLTTQRRRRS